MVNKTESPQSIEDKELIMCTQQFNIVCNVLNSFQIYAKMELEIDLSFAKGASWSLDFPVTNNKQHGYACNKHQA